jgi:hypothetical protein
MSSSCSQPSPVKRPSSSNQVALRRALASAPCEGASVLDCDAGDGAHRDATASPEEGYGLVDPHARGTYQAGQVALRQR